MENSDKQPLVSVVMATFNEPETFISESVNSILGQSYKHLELIIADDSTNKETIEALDRLAEADQRIRLIRKAERMGFVPALNEALRAAKGQLIARMDGDDVSFPDRIEKQVAYALEHPEISVFGGSMDIINEKGELVSERIYPTTPIRIKLMFLFRNPMAHPTLMFRRSIIDNGFHYNTKFLQSEDLELYLRLYKAGYKIGNMPSHLVKYRVVGDMSEKRTKLNWIYNHKARKIFIPSKPVFSVCSYLISTTYRYIPKSFISYCYSRDYKKFLRKEK